MLSDRAEIRIPADREGAVTKEILLTNGGVVLVDAADYESLAGRWNSRLFGRMVYASRRVDGGSEVLMHRQILGLTKGDGKIADHINGDGLDNRRANLRVTDRLGNARNAIGRRNTAVPFKGVTIEKSTGMFRSRIKVCKRKSLLVPTRPRSRRIWHIVTPPPITTESLRGPHDYPTRTRYGLSGAAGVG